MAYLTFKFTSTFYRKWDFTLLPFKLWLYGLRREEFLEAFLAHAKLQPTEKLLLESDLERVWAAIGQDFRKVLYQEVREPVMALAA